MTALRNPEISHTKINIVENTSLPNAIHGKHEGCTNSGLSSSKKFQEAITKTNEASRSQYKEFLNSSGETLDLYFSCVKNSQEKQNQEQKFLKEIDPEFIKHGGGSLYEYAMLAHLRGQKTTTITIHESRMMQLLYDGEGGLAEKGISRGQFTEEDFDFLLEKSQKISKELGVEIKFVLELENFGEGTMGDELREERKSFRAKFPAKNKVLSTHFMPISPNYQQIEEWSDYNPQEKFSDNYQFIDGSLNQFDKILFGQEGRRFQIKKGVLGLISNIVTTYVTSLLEQVEREGEAGMVLGHCDLIKLNIHKIIAGKNAENSEYADKIISKVFALDSVQEKYEELFDAVNEKGMLVEINLAGEAKGVGFYGKDLLPLMKEKDVKICIGSDSHKISDEQGAEKIWEDVVQPALVKAKITEILEVA